MIIVLLRALTPIGGRQFAEKISVVQRDGSISGSVRSNVNSRQSTVSTASRLQRPPVASRGGAKFTADALRQLTRETESSYRQYVSTPLKNDDDDEGNYEEEEEEDRYYRPPPQKSRPPLPSYAPEEYAYHPAPSYTNSYDASYQQPVLQSHPYHTQQHGQYTPQHGSYGYYEPEAEPEEPERVLDPASMLAYSKQPRAVEYRPYTLSDYREMHHRNAQPLKSLGPDLHSAEIIEKKQTQQRMKEYARGVNLTNKVVLRERADRGKGKAMDSAVPSRHASREREKEKKGAKEVVAPRREQRESTSTSTSTRKKTEHEEQLERKKAARAKAKQYAAQVPKPARVIERDREHYPPQGERGMEEENVFFAENGNGSSSALEKLDMQNQADRARIEQIRAEFGL